jgi:hypothetical protein
MLWRLTASALAYWSVSGDTAPKAACGDRVAASSTDATDGLLLRSEYDRSRVGAAEAAGGERDTAASVAASQAVAME